MRIQVNTILGGLCLVSLLCARANNYSFAHDLPSDRNLSYTATIDCFSGNHVAKPISHDGCYAPRPSVAKTKATHMIPLAAINYSTHYRALLNAFRQVSAPLNQSPSHLSVWWDQACHYLSQPPASSNTQLLIAQPESGSAPSPRRRPPQQSQADNLARLLKLVEDTQCEVYSALHQRDAITSWLAQAVSPSSQPVLHNLITFAVPHATQSDQPPLNVGPQFVILRLNNQGHVLLTVAQAQQWQLAVPRAQASAINMVSQAIAPLQQQAVTAVSRQLEVAGHALLQLSQSLSQLSKTEVAQREIHNRWE
jgi:hypothetical protein